MKTKNKDVRKVLIIESEYGKIKTNQRWLKCPACGWERMFQIRSDTEAKHLPIFCKRCKKTHILDILPLVPVP